MRKLIMASAVLVTLALVFTACGPKPASTVNPVVSGIELWWTDDDNTTQQTAKPLSLAQEQEIVFGATVAGTDGSDPFVAYNAAYTIEIDPADSVVDCVDNDDGTYTVTVLNTASDGDRFTVTAYADGDHDIKASWVIEISENPLEAPESVTVEAEEEELDSLGSTVLTATVEPGNASQYVEWSVAPANAGSFEIDPDDETVTFTAAHVSSVVTAIITAHTGYNDVKGTVTITISPLSTDLPADYFNDAQWVIRNTKEGALASGTTQNGNISAGANKRYVVFNNEPNALIDHIGSNDIFTDVTVMYLDTPIVPQQDGFQSFGIQARLKITGWRESGNIFGSSSGESWGTVRQGLIMGMMTGDPSEFVNKDYVSGDTSEAPTFIGLRRAAGGQNRMYYRRSGTAGYGSQTTSGESGSAEASPVVISGTSLTYQAQLELHTYQDGKMDINTGKVEGLAEQEYVFKFMRKLSGGGFRTYVYDASGNTLLFDFGTNTALAPELLDQNPMYFGFFVYGVEAEISDVKILFNEGNNEWVDSAVANATPETPKSLRVDISGLGESPLSMDSYDYAVQKDEFTSLSLSATVIPRSLVQTGTWSATGSLSVSAGGNVGKSGTGIGEGTVTFSPTVTGVTKGLKFFLLGDYADVTSVSITNTEASVASGGTLQMTKQVEPGDANPNVTWEVFAENGTSSTTDASISASGLLTAGTVGSDTDVVVKVTTVGTPTATNQKTITIKPAGTILWEWKTGDNIVSNGRTNGVATRVTGGSSAMAIVDGNMQMGTARFVVGANNTTDLTTSTYDPSAELDLSKKFKITVDYAAATAAGNFWVYIYSDTGGAGGGPVICTTLNGSANTDQRLLVLSPPIATGGTVTVTIDPETDLALRSDFTSAPANSGLTLSDVLKTATLQFRCDSGANSFVVSHIVIEYAEAGGDPPSPPTVETVTVSATGTTDDPVEVAAGDTQQFTAIVTGENSPAQTVTWTIEGTVETGTTISTGGRLTVALSEAENTTFKVRATSTQDNSKYGEYEVKVIAALIMPDLPFEPELFLSANSPGSGAATAASGELTITGTGRQTNADTGFGMGFVYVPIPRGDFTVMVKVKGGSINLQNQQNSAKINLIAIPQLQTNPVITNTSGQLSELNGNNTIFHGVGVRYSANSVDTFQLSMNRTGHTGFGNNFTNNAVIPNADNILDEDFWLRIRRVGNDWFAEATTIAAPDNTTPVDSYVAAVTTPTPVPAHYPDITAGWASQSQATAFTDTVSANDAVYAGIGVSNGTLNGTGTMATVTILEWYVASGDGAGAPDQDLSDYEQMDFTKFE